MRLAGYCFFLIGVLFIIQYLHLSALQDDLVEIFNQNNSFRSRLDDVIRIIKNMAVAQVVLLIIASFGLMAHNAMGFDDAEKKFSQFDERIKIIEKIVSPNVEGMQNQPS